MKIAKEKILKKYKSNPEFIEKFSSLFSIKLLLDRCIIDEKYVVDKKFDELIILSKSGEKIYNSLISKKISISKPEDIKLAIFLEFYHYDLLVDIEKIDLNLIENILNEEIKSKKIKYPWIYGRTLYNKYYYDFTSQSDFLNKKETTKLLKNTPQGVFQIGKYIVGPIGLIKSDFTRHNLPTRNIRLFHCSESSCSNFHRSLLKSENIFENISEEINKLLPNTPHLNG
jgi:hypothetical protein